ncbi:MAG: hypothetical protein AAGD10_01240 [Myxococcota bacterium]
MEVSIVLEGLREEGLTWDHAVELQSRRTKIREDDLARSRGRPDLNLTKVETPGAHVEQRTDAQVECRLVAAADDRS